MLRGGIPLIVLSVGCRSLLGIDEAVVAADAEVDAYVVDAYVPDAFAAICPWPYTPLYFDPCAPTAPPLQPAVVLAGGEYTLITESGQLDGPAVGLDMAFVTSVVDGARVIYVSRFEIAADASFQIRGTIPVVIASSTTITIHGDLDVSSTLGVTGAGGNAPACGAGSGGAGMSCVNGGSGGGGGGFGGVGGRGGSGANGSLCGAVEGVAGGPGGTRTFAPSLRGGCGGGRGGAAHAGDQGMPGAGGGAVNLLARNTITIAGTVDAGGEGGRSSTGSRAGGGGGGSGGMIVAQAVTIMVSGALAANGGGGGGGSSATGTTTLAQRGDDGSRTAARASGGIGEGTGGAGGPGGSGISGLASINGVDGAGSERGSGGGGGGVGVIQIRGTLTNGGIISPSPIP